jgi:hypothetical protein
MRALAIFAALALVTAPVLLAPSGAYADGFERPRQRRDPPPTRAAPSPLPAIIGEDGRETVTLPESFFEGGGGVGVDIGLEPGPVIVPDGRGDRRFRVRVGRVRR